MIPSTPHHIPLSGDAELQRLFQELSSSPTRPDSFWQRVDLLWALLMLLQRLDADVAELLPWIDRIEQCSVEEELGEACRCLDAALTVALTSFGQEGEDGLSRPSTSGGAEGAGPVQADGLESPFSASNWLMYGGDAAHHAATEDPGPQFGEIHWRFKSGLAWYVSPCIEAGKVYQSIPGMRVQMRCLDLHRGEEQWKLLRQRQGRPRPTSHILPQSYVLPAAASTPLLQQGELLVAELGAQGLEQGQRALLRVRAETGELLERIPVGAADYRMGSARLSGNGRVCVHSDGDQRIEASPPQCMGHNRVVCRSCDSGEKLWDFPVGLFFGETLLDAERVYVATQDGVLFALTIAGEAAIEGFGRSDSERVCWTYQAAGAVNSGLALAEGLLCFGSNAGEIVALDAVTGELRWRQQLEEPEARAFVQFSPARIAEGRVWIGSACKHLYCLDASTGELLWQQEQADWVRARPWVSSEQEVFCCSMAGELRSYDALGQERLRISLGDYPVFADPVEAEGLLVINDAGLQCHAVEWRSGRIVWSHPLMQHARVQGRELRTDELACGGFAQSKPTVMQGRVLVGAPSRFVHALDTQSGEELWRCEFSGAISGAPACLLPTETHPHGLVLIGQQGGADEFLGLDAGSGVPRWRQNLGWVWSSATLSNGKAYLPGCDGYFSCLDAESGALLWRQRSARAAHPESPVDAGRVFFGSWDHFLYAFNAETGALLWKFFTGGSPDSGAPIASEGRVYVPMGGKRMCCLHAENGSVLWELRPERGCMNASPALNGERLYLSLSVLSGAVPPASEIRCVHAESGEPLWKHPGGGICGASLAKDQVLAATTSGTLLRSLNPETGQLNWSVDLGDRVYESIPAISGGLAFVLTEAAELVAIR